MERYREWFGILGLYDWCGRASQPSHVNRLIFLYIYIFVTGTVMRASNFVYALSRLPTTHSIPLVINRTIYLSVMTLSGTHCITFFQLHSETCRKMLFPDEGYLHIA